MQFLSDLKKAAKGEREEEFSFDDDAEKGKADKWLEKINKYSKKIQSAPAAAREKLQKMREPKDEEKAAYFEEAAQEKAKSANWWSGCDPKDDPDVKQWSRSASSETLQSHAAGESVTSGDESWFEEEDQSEDEKEAEQKGQVRPNFLHYVQFLQEALGALGEMRPDAKEETGIAEGDAEDAVQLLHRAAAAGSTTLIDFIIGRGLAPVDGHCSNKRLKDYRPVADSFDKLELLKDICIQEEIFISPQLLHNVWVVPVLGWYHRSWDTEPPLQAPPGQELQHPPLPGEKFATDTGACKWRGFANASTELAESLDQQNQLWGIWPLPVALEENLKQPRGERKSWVISFSHFLPELELMPEKRFLFTPNLTHIVGSNFIRKRVRLLQPDLHIFGHSHFPWDMTLADGVRYKSWPLGTPAEQARRISSYPSKEIEEWHPLPVFDSLGRHYPTGPACWYSLMYTRLRRDPQSYRMASFVADVYCPEAPRVPESILSPGGLIPLEDQEQLERRERYAGKSAASMKREMNNWARAS